MMIEETFGAADIARLEKILLAKKVGVFLEKTSSVRERTVVENVARILSRDSSISVREVMAHELRGCDYLPHDIVDHIISDISEISGPFLQATNYFDDEGLASLIPGLEEPARAYVAGRVDLGVETQKSLVTIGGEISVSNLLDNKRVRLSKNIYDTIINRFGTNVHLMDHMGLRSDLTKDLVREIADKVSKKCKRHIYVEYGIEINPVDVSDEPNNILTMLSRMRGASSAQVHAFVADLRSQRNLSHSLVLDMAENGCLPFLESSLALLAGLPVGQVQGMLALKNNKSFVKLMSMADVEKGLAPRYLKIAKRHYSSQPALAA
jgi:uncharacterized protein (DUF2336 family)